MQNSWAIGATNTSYTDLLDGERFKAVPKLRECFAAKDVNIEQPITTKWGFGVTAAVVLLGLRMAGQNRSACMTVHGPSTPTSVGSD